MSVAIWKFDLDALMRASVFGAVFNDDKYVPLKLPSAHRFLTLTQVAGPPALYFLVNPDTPMETRRVRILATGENFVEAEVGDYLGTFTQGNMNGTQLMWHAFWARS